MCVCESIETPPLYPVVTDNHARPPCSVPVETAAVTGGHKQTIGGEEGIRQQEGLQAHLQPADVLVGVIKGKRRIRNLRLTDMSLATGGEGRNCLKAEQWKQVEAFFSVGFSLAENTFKTNFH